MIRTILLILIWIAFGSFGFTQYNPFSYTFVIDSIPVSLTNCYPLSSIHVVEGSANVLLRNTILNRRDFSLNYSTGVVTLSDSLKYSILDTVFISYYSLKIPLKKGYKKRDLIARYDDRFSDTIKVIRSQLNPLSAESIFGNKLEKSGTLIRGFTVGTNKDFSLQSGLRLQLSGQLSEELEIVAALTDQNTPIQPEGNTERLDELDKVFIQLKHPNFTGTFGDYELIKRAGEFGSLTRKLQGLSGEFMYGDFSGFLAIAGSRGKFNTIKLAGLDGVQGPYRLTGLNNERDIIIIAGSEKVFLDGELLKRGENNDFIIDYSNAQITFTTARLITSASRISADYEYSDRRYSRNLLGAGLNGSFFNKNLNLAFQFIKEGDDKDAPIDISFSDSDKEILKNAGADRFKAIKSGETLAGFDSLGLQRGSYEKRDTLILGDSVKYYVYSPNSLNAIYNVSFSYTGEGMGNYIRQSIGNFKYVGLNQGNYLPIVFLPFPELKQFANMVVGGKISDKLFFNLELAGSSKNFNLFSDISKSGFSGYGRTISLKSDPFQINIGDLKLGSLGFSIKDRFTEANFSSADRMNSIEFDRDYNLNGSPLNQNESLREFSLNYAPVENIKLQSTLGLLNKGADFSSTRSNSNFSYNDKGILLFDYNLDFTNTSNLLLSGKRVWQKANGMYKLGLFKPGIEFLSELRTESVTNKDSINLSSLQYFEASPYLDFNGALGLAIKLKLTYREDKLPFNGVMTDESKSTGGQFEVDYKGNAIFNSGLKLTVRNKMIANRMRIGAELDNQTVLIRSRSGFNFGEKFINGDLFYEATTQRTAKLERVFVKVEKGKGNYLYVGDTTRGGILDENKFQMTLFDGDYIAVTVPTDKLYPVIDLKTSTRWKLRFESLFKDSTFFHTVFSKFSAESQARIEENSTIDDIKKIYFMDLSAFLNDSTTLRGSNFLQQDIFLFEESQELSFRFRYNQRKSVNQFNGGAEHGYNREQSMRIRFKMVKEIGLQADVITLLNNLTAPVGSNRNRNILGTDLVLDFSYRPNQDVEAGFVLKTGNKTDAFPTIPTELKTNGQVFRLTYSLAGTGRMRIEIERSELIANTTDNFIPFELTGGNIIGKNYFWRLNFDYRISTNLQATANYDGRLAGAGRVIHTARAEVRAFF